MHVLQICGISVSLTLILRQPFPAGNCVTFIGRDCLCQRCMEPVSPSPNATSYSSSKSIPAYSLSSVHIKIFKKYIKGFDPL